MLTISKGVSDLQFKRELRVLELGCRPLIPTKHFSVYIFSKSNGIIKLYVLLQKQPSVPLCVTIAYQLKKSAKNSCVCPPPPQVFKAQGLTSLNRRPNFALPRCMAFWQMI